MRPLGQTLLSGLFFSLAVFSSCLEAAAAEKGILLTEEIQLKIADVFLEEGEYYRAVTEYKKFLILFPDSERVDYVLFQTGRAYYDGGEFESSRRSFRSVREKYPGSPYALKAYYFEGLSEWKLDKPKEAKTLFEDLAEAFPDSEYAPPALAAASLAALDREDIGAGKKGLEQFCLRFPAHPQIEKVREALLLFDDYEKLPRKSPLLAAVMSALLPGSGYFYAEHYGDGLTAFLINALFIAGSLTAVHQENYAVAGIAGGLGLPFYVGNIYGSANAAKKWNLSVRKEVRRKIYQALDFIF